MKVLFDISAVLLALLMVGCGDPEPSATVPEKVDGYQGRDDTRSLRNADAVGYDGAAIQKKLDAALDKNDQRAADLDAQIEAQAGDSSSPEER